MKTRKILVVLAACALLISSFGTSVAANAAETVNETVNSSSIRNSSENGEALNYGDFQYIIESDNTVTITKYKGSDPLVTIPDNIDDKLVAAIGENAFYACSSLRSIYIPDSVTRIKDFAFLNCESLTSAAIPNSVTSMGTSVF